MTARAGRLLTALILATLPGVVLLGSTPAGPAHAEEPKSLVSISLTSFSPSVIKPGDEIRVTGRVTNTSNRPLRRPAAYLWRSSFPLTSADQLASARKSDANDPIGNRLFQLGQYDELESGGKTTLAPKASASFTLTASTRELLSANPANGVYLMGVHVLLPKSNVAIGRTRLFVPLVNPTISSAGPNTVRLSSVVLLSSTPAQLRSGVLADDRLSQEIGPGGRLDGLLRQADTPGTSYAIDPNLITELRTMSAGYQVVGHDGRMTPGTGKAAATEWLRRFTGLQSVHDGYRLPYAGYDLAALVRHHRLDIAENAEKAADAVTGVGTLPLLIAPPGGRATQAMLDAADELDATAVLLNQSSVDGLGPVVEQREKKGDASGATILSYDTDRPAGGPGPDPRNTSVQLREGALADTYIDALTSRPGSTIGRLRVVSEPDEGSGDLRSDSAPWLELSDVAGLLKADPVSWTGKPSYPSSARKRELNDDQVSRTNRLSEAITTFGQLLAEPGDLAAQRDQTMPRIVSAAWRDQPDSQIAFVDEQRAFYDQILRGSAIHLEAKNLVLTGAAGNVPVTIVNGSNQRIRVQVTFDSPNRQRLTVQDIPAATIKVIEPGDKVPVTAVAQARANGKLPITAQITTIGNRPIGKPLVIEVNPTQAGRLGWVISFAALIVLVAATAFRIRQVRRERARTEAAGG